MEAKILFNCTFGCVLQQFVSAQKERDNLNI